MVDLFAKNLTFLSLFLLRDDFQQVSRAVKPIVSQTHPEWASPECYQQYLHQCADECAANQTTLMARSIIAQKPLQ